MLARTKEGSDSDLALPSRRHTFICAVPTAYPLVSANARTLIASEPAAMILKARLIAAPRQPRKAYQTHTFHGCWKMAPRSSPENQEAQEAPTPWLGEEAN